MKKSIGLIIAVVIAFSFTTYSFQSSDASSSYGESNKDVVQVYYFHSSHRCNTCLTVEKVTNNSLNELYPKQMKSGSIKFESIDMDEPTGEYLAKKIKVSGQTLIIIKGSERKNLTNDAFMYAKSNPDKLKAKIKKAIDEMIN